MKLILETTTGALVPGGVSPPLPRGGLDTVFLQFVTNNVAGLLAGGAPIALKLYSPADLETPLVTLAAWSTLAGDLGYSGSLDTLSGGLAYLQRGTLFGRISYGTPNVDSGWFLVNYGVGASGAAPVTPIVISQPTGPVNYVQDIGTFGDGDVVIVQVAADRTRTGTSQHCEYYPKDDKVILNGGTAKLVDSRKGVTVGRQLTFFSKKDRLLVDGEANAPVVSDMLRK